MQTGQLKVLIRGLAGEAAGKRRQCMTRLLQLLLERWDGGLGARQRSLLRHHVSQRNRTELILTLQNLQTFALAADDIIGCVELGARRSLLDRRCNDVRCQREVGSLKLVALRVSESTHRLRLSSHTAKDIERIGHTHLRCMEAEN